MEKKIKKLFIITNESYYEKSGSHYCDNIDLKSIPEELTKYIEVNVIARKSVIQRTKLVKNFKIRTANNILSFLYSVLDSTKDNKSEYLIISVSPYTFLASLILKIFNKKHFIYLRSDGYEEYNAIFGKIGYLIYHILFSLSSIRAYLISCREHILRKKKGLIVNPSQINENWLKNLKEPNFQNFKLLYVGRLRVEKGIFSLLNLLENSNLKLTIVTSEKNVSIKKKNENVSLISFENYNDAIIKFYDEHSIFILPSYTEGHPQVLDEALARQRPVIIFEDIAHVIRNRKGIFVSKRNIKSLEETIEFIIGNYSNIKEELKANILPTKKNFINELKKIILEI